MSMCPDEPVNLFGEISCIIQPLGVGLNRAREFDVAVRLRTLCIPACLGGGARVQFTSAVISG